MKGTMNKCLHVLSPGSRPRVRCSRLRPYHLVTRRSSWLKTKRKEKSRMKKSWVDVLVAVLVAATEGILEVTKILRKKGKAV